MGVRGTAAMPWKMLSNTKHALTLQCFDVRRPESRNDGRVAAKRPFADDRIRGVVPDVQVWREIHIDADCRQLLTVHLTAVAGSSDGRAQRLDLADAPLWTKCAHAALD